jgi:hypothetical protein
LVFPNDIPKGVHLLIQPKIVDEIVFQTKPPKETHRIIPVSQATPA